MLHAQATPTALESLFQDQARWAKLWRLVSLGALQKSWATAHPRQEPVAGELMEAASLQPWQVSSGDGFALDPALLGWCLNRAQLTSSMKAEQGWDPDSCPSLLARAQLCLSDLAQCQVSLLAPARSPPMV